MEDFILNDRIKKYIAEKLNVNINVIESCFSIYKDYIRKSIRENYLAHYIRAIENIIRKITKNDLFCILYQPFKKKDPDIGIGMYYENSFYTICYPNNLDDIQIRDCIAHELGHLLIATLLKNNYPEKYKDENIGAINSEPISSIFGILCMLDYSNFYKERRKKFVRENETKIVDDFLFITNKNKP